MSKLWFTSSGKLALCESGEVGIGDECVCGCPDFEGRIIAYVDKHATGTGDGLSWTDAFTNIQTAIDTYPKREIQIQGYGESDTYSGGIDLAECVYLLGIGNVWIEGGNAGFGITGNNYSTFRQVDNINVKNFFIGIGNLNLVNILNCNVKDNVDRDIGTCVNSNILNCITDTVGGGINDCENSTITNCISNNGNISGNGLSIITSCTVNNAGIRNNNDANLINCNVNNAPDVGFLQNIRCTFNICSATGCFNCGFQDNADSTFIGCTDSGNCISVSPSCTVGNPSFGCDEV